MIKMKGLALMLKSSDSEKRAHQYVFYNVQCYSPSSREPAPDARGSPSTWNGSRDLTQQ